MDSKIAKSKEQIQAISYKIAEQFNEYDLSIDEAQQVVDYLHKRIFPFQINRSLTDVNQTPKKFKVVTPQTLSLSQQ